MLCRQPFKILCTQSHRFECCLPSESLLTVYKNVLIFSTPLINVNNRFCPVLTWRLLLLTGMCIAKTVRFERKRLCCYTVIVKRQSHKIQMCFGFYFSVFVFCNISWTPFACRSISIFFFFFFSRIVFPSLLYHKQPKILQFMNRKWLWHNTLWPSNGRAKVQPRH